MRRELLHEDHWAILEARLLRQRARIGLGQLKSVESELREIGEAAASRLGPDHPLTIQVASAQLDYATAVHDSSLSEICAARLANLRKRPRGGPFQPLSPKALFTPLSSGARASPAATASRGPRTEPAESSADQVAWLYEQIARLEPIDRSLNR